MAANGWQYQKKVTVPNGGSVSVVLPPSRPVLAQLTIWASSGERTLTNMTFQPRVNTKNFGASLNIAAARAADIVMAMNGATRDQALIPAPPPLNLSQGTTFSPTGSPIADPYAFDVLVSNAGASPEDVSLFFLGIGLDGG